MEQEGLAAGQLLPGNNPADCRAGKKRHGTKTMKGITAIPAAGIRLRYRLALVKVWPRRAHVHVDWPRSMVETSWALGHRCQQCRRSWNLLCGARRKGVLEGWVWWETVLSRNVAKICPSCITTAFQKPSSTQVHGKEPRGRLWTCINSRNWVAIFL